MYIPIWVIVLTLLTATIAVILWQQGKKPSDWYERVIEVVGKPYVLWVFIGAAAVLGAAYWFYLSDIIASVHDMVKHLRTQAAASPEKVDPENLKNLAQGSALLLGALVAAATLIFTLIRVWINERTTTAEEEGLITDRINAAVASLGAEKTIKKGKDEQTVPNIEVRIGAILALERMAKINADVHIQIMEILTAYIRENAPATEEEHDRPPRHDIQLAFTVIGRRPKKRIAQERVEDFRLDLRDFDLTRIDGEGLDFGKAQLQGARFIVSSLRNANLQGADLWDANLQSAKNITDAVLRGASVRSIAFTDIPISQDQIDEMFGRIGHIARILKLAIPLAQRRIERRRILQPMVRVAENPATRRGLTTCSFGLRFLFCVVVGAVGDIVIAVVAGALAQFFFGRHIILDTHAHIDRQNTVDAVLVSHAHFFEKLDHVGFKIQGHFGFRGTRFDVPSDGVPFVRKHVHRLNGDVVFVHAHQIG